jgi:xylose isomerase
MDNLLTLCELVDSPVKTNLKANHALTIGSNLKHLLTMSGRLNLANLGNIPSSIILYCHHRGLGWEYKVSE